MSPSRQGSKYNLVALPRFEKDLRKLDAQTRRRILATLRELQHSPEIGKPLHGALKGVHSLRIGDYRVLYQVAEKKLEIYVMSAAHRKHAYE